MTRRPIKTRGAAWVQGLARRLGTAGLTPNQISQMSMVFAALAWVAFSATTHSTLTGLPHPAVFFLLAALCIQLRLLCNLLDGIVAVEGGKSTPDGAFWNEAPDRLSDVLILSGLGYAAGSASLGLIAGALAVSTAYLRELGRAEGMPSDFSGPLAKPQRMAAATFAALLAATMSLVAPAYVQGLLLVATVLIITGTALTVIRRSRRLIHWLSENP